MNAGQKLVELSGLSSGSALTHLLAITQGTGTGVDRVVFASRFSVSIEDSQITLVQRDRKSVAIDQERDRQASSEKNAYVMVKQLALVALTAKDEAFITTKTAASFSTISKPQSAFVSSNRSAVHIGG